MRALSGTKVPDAVADPIIWQPSVRTMLLTQKAVSEGGRSMLYECAKLGDKMQECKDKGDEAGAHAIDERLGFLTPILKGFLTEAGKEAADLGIQAYGGHGFIKDNKAEQVYRDVRIAALWEGTTQIQALDLLGRKIMLQKLAPINEHCSQLYAQCRPLLLSSDSQLRKHAWSLLSHAAEWQFLTYRIALRARNDKEWIASTSVDYLMYAGHVTLASHWLKQEVVATAKLAELAAGGETAQEADFFKAKIQTSQFVFDGLLPRTRSMARGMFTPIESITQMHKDHFSFDHAR
jgi:hypothetical protein